jgi:hypothetical protein
MLDLLSGVVDCGEVVGYVLEMVYVEELDSLEHVEQARLESNGA